MRPHMCEIELFLFSFTIRAVWPALFKTRKKQWWHHQRWFVWFLKTLKLQDVLRKPWTNLTGNSHLLCAALQPSLHRPTAEPPWTCRLVGDSAQEGWWQQINSHGTIRALRAGSFSVTLGFFYTISSCSTPAVFSLSEDTRCAWVWSEQHVDECDWHW